MSRKTIEGSVSVCRVTSGRGDYVTISFRDEVSRTRFAEAQLSYEAFGKLMAGLSETKANIEVSGLNVVGKERKTQDRQLIVDGSIYDKAECIELIKKNSIRDAGWHLVPYLGSKDSVVYRDGKTVITYTVERFEEVTCSP